MPRLQARRAERTAEIESLLEQGQLTTASTRLLADPSLDPALSLRVLRQALDTGQDELVQRLMVLLPASHQQAAWQDPELARTMQSTPSAFATLGA